MTKQQTEQDFELLLELRKIANSAIQDDLQKEHLLRLSVMSGCYQIFRNSNGDLLGYFAWANVIRETVSRLYRSGEYPFYPCEWSEGGVMLIIDVCFTPHFSSEAKIAFRSCIKNRRAITYRKGNRINLWLKCFRRYSSHVKFL